MRAPPEIAIEPESLSEPNQNTYSSDQGFVSE
jgi:hypothetical protein